MSEIELETSSFPAFVRSVRARWAPVLLNPITGSYECLVVGVAVASDSGFHIELANALDRLGCLNSENADGAVYAIEISAEALRRDLAERGVVALTDPRPPVIGISVGECRDAEGDSLQAIGASWMRALSSLYQEDIGIPDTESAIEAANSIDVSSSDRLPSLVMRYVTSKRDGYFRFFNEDLRENRKRRLTGRSHDIIIDFSGSRLVANFGTLQAGNIARSVNLIKRRLWDLKVERDREPRPVVSRKHEMILQSPPADDPQITDRQHANLQDALNALEAQADQEELRLRALHSVSEIGEHVLQVEAA